MGVGLLLLNSVFNTANAVEGTSESMVLHCQTEVLVDYNNGLTLVLHARSAANLSYSKNNIVGTP